MAENLSFGPEWLRNVAASSSSVGNGGIGLVGGVPPSASTAGSGAPASSSLSLKKTALADYRYGREEMLALLLDDPPLPQELGRIPVLCHAQPLQPLAMIPLTEIEQHALAGNVNSETPHTYNMRSGMGGAGGWSTYYSQRGRSGRGRGGRSEYYRPPNSGDDHGDRGSGSYYHRQAGTDAHRTTGGGGESRGGYVGRIGGGSRSLSWRNSGNDDDGAWTNQWHTTPTSPAKPLGPSGGRSWIKEGGARKVGGRQFLPEWAADDSDRDDPPQPPVGTFDNKGRFSVGEEDGQPSTDPGDKKKSVVTEKIREESPPEDNVFDNGPLDEKLSVSETAASSRVGGASLLLRDASPDAPPAEEEDEEEEEGWKERHSSHNDGSMDSMEEMARRFEKTAEAVLFTEDEDTPTPSPSPKEAEPHKQQPQIPAPSTPESMQSWLYRDPHGEVQGPFSTQEMQEWFMAGYFTMDLMVRRVCDTAMLPLGQLIRIYGHVPFAPGPVPPPMRPGEQFWQQLFQHQYQLFSQTPGLLHSFQQQEAAQNPSAVAAAAATASCDQAAPIQQQVPPTTEHASSIWSVGDEQKWPEILPQSKKPEILPPTEQSQERAELERREELQRREAEEERRRLEEIQRKEEIELREREEHERKCREEQLAREREEQRRKEEERQQELERAARLERERLERERQQQAEMEELERQLAQQKLEEERQRRARAEEARLVQLEKNTSWGNQQDASPLLHTAMSLVQIQKEEHIQAVREQRQMEELRIQQQTLARLQQQQQQQQSQNSSGGGGSWAHGGGAPSSGGAAAATPTERPVSFLEIQQEQRQQSGVVSSAVSKKAQKALTNSVAPSSWSQIAAPSKPPPASSPAWGGSRAPPTRPTSLRPAAAVQQGVAPASTGPALSFWEECALEAKNTREMPPSAAVGRERRKKLSAPTPNSVRIAADREEEKVRQLFIPSTPDEEFTDWCARELKKFETDVDAAVLTSLLLDVESTYEVHDYIRGCLGETDAVHAFAKQFLERRQRITSNKQQQQQQQQRRTKPVTQDKSLVGGASVGVAAPTSTSANSRNSKKKKKKMQKVHPAAMLGFTVNAGERMNAGEIQSAKDAM